MLLIYKPSKLASSYRLTRLQEENTHRSSHDYQPGDQAYIIDKEIKHKLSPLSDGPIPIIEVHTNGTVVLQIKPNLYQRINIRQLKPHHA
jgi:hypothetical protein